MPALSPDAADTVKLVRELQLMDEHSIRMLEQLFLNRMDDELISSLIRGNEASVAVALFKVCAGAHSPHILGYTLRFLSDLVYADSRLGEQYGDAAVVARLGANPASSFLQFANAHADKLGVLNPAVYLAAVALRHGNYEMNKESFEAFFQLVRRVFGPEELEVAEVEFSVQACIQVARHKEFRHLFFEENIIEFIPRLLTDIVSSDSASIIQVIYETLVLTWLLSFEYEGVVQLVKKKMIPQLHRVLQRVQKEKCVRVTLMILLNLVEAERKFTATLTGNHDEWVDPAVYTLSKLGAAGGGDGVTTQLLKKRGPSLVAEMVGVGMLKTLSQLARRKFGDEDINGLVRELVAALEKSVEVLTSFSEYRGEVLSGSLEWTPVHTSAKFWRENASKVDENEYEVLTALGKLLLNTRDETTLAVACHDLGEIVRYHPTGRTLLTLPSMAGVKERVMNLMSHPNAEIGKEALLSTQKIMVQRWEFIAA